MSELTRTVPEYVDLFKRSNELPAFKRREPDTLHSQAVSYVWGFQDGCGQEKDSQEAWDFGLVYWSHALDYAGEKIGCRINIPDAFKAWRETGRIERS